MKKLVLLLLLLPIFTKSQDKWIGKDKAYHIVASSAMTFMFTDYAYEFKLKKPELIGCSLALSVGLAKEFLIDPKVSGKDLAADAVGVVAGYYLTRYMNKKLHRRYK